MKLNEAQNIAFKLANLHSDQITLKEIKDALIILANFYEDNKQLLNKKSIKEYNEL